MLNKLLKAFTLLIAITTSFSSIATIELMGKAEQGGLMVGKTALNNTVTLNNKPLAISSNGHFVFGFGRDDLENYLLEIKTPSGIITKKQITPLKRTYKVQRIEGIKKSIMHPDPKAVARSQKDSKQIKLARKTNSELIAFSTGFIAPIDGVITGVYGSQRVFNGVPKRPHFGLDYAGKEGDPVKAPASGRVILFVPDMFYSGGTMIIDHGHGVTSTFLHLSKSYVEQGADVNQGDVIAAVGSSGRATGPHLDWRINWFDIKIDPELVLTLKGM